MFSLFHDKMKYNGAVPSAKTLEHATKLHHATVRPYMDAEVKKRGVKFMHIDASFKITKKMGTYHSKKVMDGLVTLNNPYSETRAQWFIGTDGHDQYEAPLDALLHTLQEYGQEGPQLAFTDNPARDRNFLLQKFPTLSAEQDRLDAIKESQLNDKSHEGMSCDHTGNRDAEITADHPTNLGTRSTGYVVLSDEWVEENLGYWDSVEKINSVAASVRGLITQRQDRARYIALDAEWQLKFNSQGTIIGSGPVSLIQIAFRDDDQDAASPIKVHLFNVHSMKNLPDRLAALLKDNTITFVGCQINGDVRRIATDFPKQFLSHGNAHTEDISAMV